MFYNSKMGKFELGRKIKGNECFDFLSENMKTVLYGLPLRRNTREGNCMAATFCNARSVRSVFMDGTTVVAVGGVALALRYRPC